MNQSHGHTTVDSLAPFFNHENSPIVFSLNTKYEYTFFNEKHAKTMQSIWGETIEIGRNMLTIIRSEHDRKKAKSNFERVFSNQSFKVVEEYGDPKLKRITYETQYFPYLENDRVAGVTVIVSDISEHKRLELDLRNQLDYQSESLSSGQIGLWKHHIKEGTIYFSKEWKNMFGYQQHEFPDDRKAWISLLHPEDRPWVLARTQEVIDGKEHQFEIEYRALHRAGYYIWVLSKGQVELDVNGHPVKFSGTHTDITASKHRELEQVVKEELVHQTEQLANSGYFILDVANDRWTSSKSLDNIFGIDENFERSTAGWLSIVHEDQQEEMQSYQAEILDQHETFDKKYRIVNQKNKNVRLVHGKGKLKYDSEGSAIAMICILQDITDIEDEKNRFSLTEDLLTESEKFLSSLINSVPGAVLKYRLLNDGSDKLEFLSKGAQDIWEIPPITAIQNVNLLWDQVVDDDLPAMKASIAKSMDQLTFWDHDWRIQTPSGQIKWINGRGIPERQSDGSMLWNTLIIDISALKAAEDEIAEKRKRHESLIDTIDGVVWESVGEAFLFSFLSDKVKDVLGFETSEWLKPGGWEKSIHPNHRERVIEDSKKFARLVKNHELEYQIRKANGQYIWVRDIVSVRKKGSDIISQGIIINIDKHKKAQMRLAEEKVRVNRIIEATSAGTWEMDLKTWRGQINENWAKIMGYSKADFVPFKHTQFKNTIHPEDLPIASKSIKDHLSGKHAFIDVEIRQRHRNGHWVWVHSRGKVVERDGDGNPLKIGGTHLDITQKKEAELELIKSRERYKFITDNTNDVIILLDSKFKHQYVSPSVQKIFGYSQEEFMQMGSHDIIVDKDHYLREIGKVLQHENSELIREYKVRKKDGTEIWVETRKKFVRNKNGKVLNILQRATDITKRKEAELELLEKKDQLELAFDMAKIGFFKVDVASGKVQMNKNQAEIFDWDKNESNLGEIRQMVIAEDRADSDQRLIGYANGINVDSARLRIKTKHKTKTLLTSGRVFNKSPFNKEINIINLDITSIVENESKLQQTLEQLEKALNDKNVLFRELHHRIKNNLQMISSILFIKSVGGDQKIKEFSKDINNRILAVARIHEHLLQLEEASKIKIDQYLTYIIKDLKKAHENSLTKIEWKTAVEPIEFDADTTLIIGLLVHEISQNALKHAFPDLLYGCITIELSKQRDHVLLKIFDDGIGFQNARPASKIGTQLIEVLVGQLPGTYVLHHQKGTCYEIVF